MLLASVVATSATVAATRSRKAKVVALAELIATASATELEVVASFLAGSLRQRRTGLGWRSMTTLPEPAEQPTLGVAEVDAAFEAMAGLAGSGSQLARQAAVDAMFGRATRAEQEWLRAVVSGGVRQGALDALLQEAVAVAADVPLTSVRRAAMLAGSTVAVVVAAVTAGEPGLSTFRLEVGRPVLPMLASSAKTLAEAITKVGGGTVAVDTKLDGIRIQVHRDGDEVRITTRSLDVITHRLPEVVEIARALPARSFVLDGEAIALDAEGRPRPFQETASRTATSGSGGVAVTPYFFDILHRDGEDLMDRAAAERFLILDDLVPAAHRIDRFLTDDVTEADHFASSVLAAGHEGVVVKSLAASYDAGRRGVGVGQGQAGAHARPRGARRRMGQWAPHRASLEHPPGCPRPGDRRFRDARQDLQRDDRRDAAWQTERFADLSTSPTDGSASVVHVRPEQVVEIAFDGLQRSSRYPGGLALRFARVVRYRGDKTAGEADTIDMVRALAP